MKEFRARFFSKLDLTDGEVTLTQEEMHSDRLVRLFFYLIANRDKVCSIADISDAIWGMESDVNISGAVKNLAWRLRKFLKNKWPDEDFILTFKGSYKINPNINIATDYDRLTELTEEGRRASDLRDKVRLLDQAFQTYRGRFMADYDTDHWVMNIAAYYQNYFVSLAKELAGLYEMLGEYEEVERVINRATLEEPLDEELWAILIRSLGAAGKFRKAEQTFHSISEKLYDALGIGPSEELVAAYENSLDQIHDYEAGIETIMAQLRESNSPVGAFYCEFGVFKKIYELSARRLRRFGYPIHIALVDLHLKDDRKGGREDGSVIEKGMEMLRDSILSSLRSGDVVTRYSRTQYVIMLPACKYETGEKVMKRIFDDFEGKRGSGRYVHPFTLREMPGTQGENIPVQNSTGSDSLRICVDHRSGTGDFGGHVTGAAVKDPVSFEGTAEFFSAVNRILDDMGRPQTNSVQRRFSVDSRRSDDSGKESSSGSEVSDVSWQYAPPLYHTAEEIRDDKGKLATFNIRFFGRNNSTWQGTIFDDEGDEAPFVSELDMMHKVNSMIR